MCGLEHLEDELMQLHSLHTRFIHFLPTTECSIISDDYFAQPTCWFCYMVRNVGKVLLSRLPHKLASVFLAPTVVGAPTLLHKTPHIVHSTLLKQLNLPHHQVSTSCNQVCSVLAFTTFPSPCSYSPLLLSQLFAFCVLWCLAFLLCNAVLCVLSCFLLADCSWSFGLVDVISL
jgi:hypothetical protein